MAVMHLVLCIILLIIAEATGLQLEVRSQPPFYVDNEVSVYWKRDDQGKSVHDFIVFLEPGRTDGQRVEDGAGDEGTLKFELETPGKFFFRALEDKGDGPDKELKKTDSFHVEPKPEPPPATTPKPSSPTSSTTNLPSTSLSTTSESEAPSTSAASSAAAPPTETSKTEEPNPVTSSIPPEGNTVPTPSPTSSRSEIPPNRSDNVLPTAQSSNAIKRTSPTGKIVGGVLGTILGLALLGALLVFIRRRRMARRKAGFAFNREMMVRTPHGVVDGTSYSSIEPLRKSPATMDDW